MTSQNKCTNTIARVGDRRSERHREQKERRLSTQSGAVQKEDPSSRGEGREGEGTGEQSGNAGKWSQGRLEEQQSLSVLGKVEPGLMLRELV